MTPAELDLARGAIRAVRATASGRGIAGPAALRLADAADVLIEENERMRADRDDVRAELTNLQIAFNDWKVTHSTVRLEVEIERLRAALDALGVAIADAGYTWTPEMRAAYEKGEK